MRNRLIFFLSLLFSGALLVVPTSARAFPCAANGGQVCLPSQWQPRYPAPFGVYTVQQGDWLSTISRLFQVDLAMLVRVNRIANPSHIEVGQRLIIPGRQGHLARTLVMATPQVRGSVVERQTLAARQASPQSPFYQKTWVTYYGRPQIPVMGILGEYSITDLVPLLRAQAEVYDRINGAELGVMPAFHLVYGMATTNPGKDKDHLNFLADEVVKAYIARAQEEGWAVILDIQIGALSPKQALAFGLPWLKYDNVHLALDPEFALVHEGQTRPGVPIGFVTAAQINEAQEAMAAFMKKEEISGARSLIVHQFMSKMIKEKADLKRVAGIDLAIVADGFGRPWPKVTKYNAFIDSDDRFAGIKLFYKWDVPLLSEREVLGIDQPPGTPYIQVTPNLIIYQ